MRAVVASLLVLATSACTSVPATPSRTRSPAAVQVVCPAGHVDAECFRRASELCGAAGYDLFDAQGRRATVADAEFRILEARCRR